MNGGFTVDAIDKTPKEIVGLLDQYVIGQDEAKKAIAIALRNRYRRMQLDPAMQEELSLIHISEPTRRS